LARLSDCLFPILIKIVKVEIGIAKDGRRDSASISEAVKVSSLTVASAGESEAVGVGVVAGVGAGLAAALSAVAGLVEDVRAAGRRRVCALTVIAATAIKTKTRGLARVIKGSF
jgi:hypothetical protein